MNDLLKKLPKDSRPRERLLKSGANNLSDYELLSIVLGSGGRGKNAVNLAKDLLIKYGSLKKFFDQIPTEIAKNNHLGLAKACQINSIGEISRRISSDKVEDFSKKTISGPEDIYKIVKPKFTIKNKEQLYLICMNSRMRLISVDLISIGTVNEALIHPREIFRTALENNSVFFAMAHNHPSGDVNPSQEDINITSKISESSVTVGLKLIDHLILANESFLSMKSKGLF